MNGRSVQMSPMSHPDSGYGTEPFLRPSRSTASTNAKRPSVAIHQPPPPPGPLLLLARTACPCDHAGPASSSTKTPSNCRGLRYASHFAPSDASLPVLRERGAGRAKYRTTEQGAAPMQTPINASSMQHQRIHYNQCSINAITIINASPMHHQNITKCSINESLSTITINHQ